MLCPKCNANNPGDSVFCVKCGSPISPTPTISSEKKETLPGVDTPGTTTRFYCPWEDRAKLGFSNAFIETIKAVLMRPTGFFQKLPPVGNMFPAVGYAVMVVSIGAIFMILWQMLAGMISIFSFGSFLHPMRSFAGAASMAIYVVYLVVAVITVPIGVVIYLFISTAITHLCLMLVKGANKGFETTLRAICYACSPSILGIIPICGAMIGGIWQLVLVIIGLKETHDTTYGKAIAAVLLPFVFAFCCAVFVIGGFMGFGYLLAHLKMLGYFTSAPAPRFR